jgi:DNA-binding IclR family transcriptional regulator
MRPRSSRVSSAPARQRAAAAPRVRYRIQVLDRAAAILGCFDVNSPELSVGDVAERTALHKSTAHRILMALQQNGLVEQNPVSGLYHLGLQLVKLGEHAIGRLDVRLVARPIIADLAAQVKDVVHLAVMDGDQVVMLDRVDVPSAAATPSLPGRLFPAHCTSLGKAMLAGMDEAEVRRLLGKRPLKRFTPGTPQTVEALLQDLRTVRARGYAIADEEMALGVASIGAAIRNHAGAIAAAVSVTAPPARLRAGHEVFAERVMQAAGRVSARLGYDGDASPDRVGNRGDSSPAPRPVRRAR